MSQDAFDDRVLLVEVAGEEVIRITLDVGGGVHTDGEAIVAGAGGAGEAAAVATAAALTDATPPNTTVTSEWFAVITTGAGQPDIAVVLAGVHQGEARETHAGAVAMRGDIRVAAARAVLDATNRRLQFLRR